MGGRPLIEFPRPTRQNTGDVLHELAQLDPRSVKVIDQMARRRLDSLKQPADALRGKHLRPVKATLKSRRRADSA